MKRFYYFLLFLLSFSLPVITFGADNYLGISDSRLRNGNVDLNDIPNAIRSAIDFFLGIAGTVAVIFVVIGAYKILFGSLQQDKTKGRDTIIMALGGFAIASLAWFIVKILIANLS